MPRQHLLPVCRGAPPSPLSYSSAHSTARSDAAKAEGAALDLLGRYPPKSAQELQGIAAGQRDGAAGSCAYLSRRGSPEEQRPQLLPTSISCTDLQHKGAKIPPGTSPGTPRGGTAPIHSQREADPQGGGFGDAVSNHETAPQINLSLLPRLASERNPHPPWRPLAAFRH